MPIPIVTRILVADDYPIVRSGLKKVLDAVPDLEVVAEAEDGAEAVEKALSEDIDLVILDVSMPRMTGIQAAAELHKRKPELKTLMLSMHDSEQFLFEARRESIKDQRVLPDVCVNPQRELGAGIAEPVERRDRHEYLVADAADVDHDPVGLFVENPAAEMRDHDRDGL